MTETETASETVDKVKRYPVVETFGPTVQGEGHLVGSTCLFIRFGGCDYRCSWCDSMHAVDPVQVKANSELLTVSQIVERMEELASPRKIEWIIFSGGNPLLLELSGLVKALHEAGYNISVETQGSKWKDWLTEVDMVCISPKGPSSGMDTDWEALRTMAAKLHMHNTPFFFKVPIFNLQDIEYLETLYQCFRSLQSAFEYQGDSQSFRGFYASIGNFWAPGSEMYSSAPEDEQDMSLMEFRNRICEQTRQVTEMLLQNKVLSRHIRIIPQMHTLLWGNEKGR